MQEWVRENLLALYGAIVGTVALLVNFVRLRHAIRRDSVRLKVSACRHRAYDRNLEALRQTDDERPWSRAQLVPVYSVTVTNTGSVPAHLTDVGVVAAGERRGALVHYGGEHNILDRVGEVRQEPIPPKASRSFEVYLKRDEPIFSPRRCYVVDAVGREWRSRMTP